MTVKTRRPVQGYDWPVDLEEFGRLLRAERERQGLSRETLCEMITPRLSQDTLVKLEKGTGNPEIRTLLRVVDALGIRLSPLVQAVERGIDAVINEEKSGSADVNLMSHKGMTYPVQPTFDTVRDHQPRPININAAEGVSNGTLGARPRVEIPDDITEAEARILEHIGTLLVRTSAVVLSEAENRRAPGEKPRRRATDR